MTTSNLQVLLTAWRAAERRWEATPGDDPGFREACIDVLRAWLAYHEAVDQRHPGEFALVADDERSYVAASATVHETLGFSPESMLGRRVEEFTAPALVADTPTRWADFIVAGRQDGEFEMLRQDGTVICLRYQARAHYPIANFHLSRLWPASD